MVGSLLLSAYTMLLPQLPNDDAYTYIRTAEIYLQDGLAAAFDHYAWAAYSVLIAWVSRLGMDLFTAAFVLNAFFFAIITWAYLSILRELDSTNEFLFIGALTILLFPEINEYRYMIIRDTGFWALALFALYQLLLYAKSTRSLHGVLFCLALLLGSCLRPEAIIFLVLAPAFLLLDNRRNPVYSRREVFNLWAMAAGGLLLFLFILVIAGVNLVQLFSSFTLGYQSIIAANFFPDPEQTNALVNALFGQHGAQYSSDMVVLFMVAGLLALLVGELVSGIGLPFSILLIWGWVWRLIKFDRNEALPLIGFAAINLLIALLFVFATHYLDSRYVMLLCLMVVALVPGIVNSILASSGERRQQARAWIIFFFMFAAVDAYVSFGRSQQYLEDTAQWVQDNSVETTTLLTNNRTVAFLSEKVEEYDRVERLLGADQVASLARGDLVAVEVFYEMDQLLAEPAVRNRLGLETEFSEGEDVRIRIYRIIN